MPHNGNGGCAFSAAAEIGGIMSYTGNTEEIRQAFEKARALHLAGHLKDAEKAHHHVLELDPDCIPALHALGRIKMQQGEAKSALTELSRAAELAPDQPAVLNDYAVALIQSGAPERAAEMFRQVIALEPDNAEIYRNLGLLLVTHRQYEEAMPVLTQCVRLAPYDGDAHLLLANVYCNLEKYPEALDQLALTMAAKPAAAAPYETLGIIRHRQHRPEEALAAFDEALKRNPDNPGVIGLRGITMAALGRFADARQSLMTAIAGSKHVAEFLRTLADLGKFTPDDARLPLIEARKADMAGWPADEQVEMNLAIAKACDDLGRRDEAMQYWMAANALQRRIISYDETAELKLLEDSARVFTRDMLAHPHMTKTPSELPVFIVGMPRSGTSLVEQILASHPDVFGAGELMNWNRMILGGLLGADYPAHVAEVPEARWHQLGSRYIDQLKAVGGSAKRVTDKMPNNFRWLGAIHLALPQAKFIHIHRNPDDCALSCFSKSFPYGFGYIYDLAELGRYMRGYEKLMAHWRTVLPEDCLLDVSYEELVQDFEGVTRRMLAFLGLDWDEACRTFYKTERHVMTASVYAVRQPMNAHSVGRAKAYAAWLKPFRDAYTGV